MQVLEFFEDQSYPQEYGKVMAEVTESFLSYAALLKKEYSLVEEPEYFVWTSQHLATTLFSDVPIPAYTRNTGIFLSPELTVWKNIFHEQLAGEQLPEVDLYYQTHLVDQLKEIACHELTHHLDLFPGDFADEWHDIWFEEGMCFYLPRKLLKSPKEFEKITAVEGQLTKVLFPRYGQSSLRNFGEDTYDGTMASIMFEYWRSFLAVKVIVENYFKGDVKECISAYSTWYQNPQTPIKDYLQITPDEAVKRYLES